MTWLRQLGGTADAEQRRLPARRDARRSTRSNADPAGRDAGSHARSPGRQRGGELRPAACTGSRRASSTDRNPVVEHFRMATGARRAVRSASTAPRTGRPERRPVRAGHVQPVDDLHINVGVRYDHYKLVIEDSRAQPAGRRRLSRARHRHGAARLLQPHLHAAVLGEPAALELARGAGAVAEPGEAGEDVQPERQHAYEVGVQQALGTRAKIDRRLLPQGHPQPGRRRSVPRHDGHLPAVGGEGAGAGDRGAARRAGATAASTATSASRGPRSC